jgi:5-methylcytosine-specific restriction endonuclease McrA
MPHKKPTSYRTRASRERRSHTTVWAREARAALVEELGGVCAQCGATERLELDHIVGRDYAIDKLSSHCRIRRLRDEASRGLLQVLCRSCNARKGTKLQLSSDIKPPHPF